MVRMRPLGRHGRNGVGRAMSSTSLPLAVERLGRGQRTQGRDSVAGGGESLFAVLSLSFAVPASDVSLNSTVVAPAVVGALPPDRVDGSNCFRFLIHWLRPPRMPPIAMSRHPGAPTGAYSPREPEKRLDTGR